VSAPICPYCGDGMESIGTLNHIECATKLLAEVERLRSLQGGPAMTDKPAESAVERAIYVIESAESEGRITYEEEMTVRAALAELKAENEALRREAERLKVCGLCCHCVGFAGNTPPSCNSPDTVQDEGAFAHFISDVLTPCHFAPSRWKEAER
jgi:hypothetical protein